MPYCWTTPDKSAAGPQWQLHLWPHRSLPPQGFVLFIGATAAMLMLPLIALLGTPILWVMLPFLGGALALAWLALARNTADAKLSEDLTLWPDRLELVRQNPRAPDQSWQASAHNVRIEIHAKGGPVENYITLTGGDRKVELGAFLSPDERITLYRSLSDRMRQHNINAR